MYIYIYFFFSSSDRVSAEVLSLLCDSSLRFSSNTMAYSIHSKGLLWEFSLLIFFLVIASHHSKVAGSSLQFLGEQPFRAFSSRSAHLGKVLYQVFAVNSLSGDSSAITYTLVGSNSTSSRFSVAQETGEINLTSYFPSLEGYTLTIEANSARMDVTERADITIAVITELHAQARFEHEMYELQVSEDTPVNRDFSVINAFSLATTEIEYSESYSIAGGTSGNVFGIDQTNGILSVRKQLDREMQDEYFLIVQFTYGSRSIFAQVRVLVLDSNDNAPKFDSAVYSISVSESVPISSTILTVSATDPDLGSGGIVWYTLSPSVQDQFSLNSTTGVLVLSKPLDYETVPVYHFTINAIDHGDPPLNSTVVVIINVLNVDDECPVFQNSIFLTYRSAGSTEDLSKVVATDPDRLGEVRYSIVSDTGDGSSDLSIDPNTGIISRASGGSSTGQYFLNVSASDANCLMMSFVPVEIRLDGTENSSPRFQGDCMANLTEKPPLDTEVVTLRALDEDEGFYGRVTYSLSDSTYFSIDSSTGVVRTVQPPSSYDRERTPILQVGVLARDGGLQQDYCLLTVTLSDKNDNTPTFATQFYSTSLNASAPHGTFVLNVSAFDNDAGSNGVISYSLSTPSSAFVIDPDTGIIRTNEPLTESSYTLTAIAADEGSPALASSVLVTITLSTASFPVFNQTYYSATVCETLFSTGMILTIEASNSPVYQIGRGPSYESNSGSAFRLSGNSIVMGSNEVINFERLGSRKSFLFSVEAINSQGSTMATVEIFVRDLDDNSPQASGVQSFDLAENQPIGTVVGKIVATDLDSGIYGDIAFDLNFPSSYFNISADGTIRSKRVFDYERAGEDTTGILQVRAYNPNQLTIENKTECTAASPDNSAIFPVRWLILDQDDEPPRFGMESYTFDVFEDHDIGTDILAFDASDSDNVDSLHYSIFSGNDDGTFSVNGNRLILRLRLNAERRQNYTLVVNVTDGIHYSSTCPRCTASIHIRVTRIDDTPPIFGSSSYNIELAENAAVGTLVLSVTAEDPDSDAIRYFLSSSVQHLFTISEVGSIFVSGPLDRESFPDGVISFLVFAEGGSISSVVVNVTLLDVNDYAPKFEGIYIGTVEENLTPGPDGIFVAQVQAFDLDQGRNGAVTYRLETGMEYGFEIDSDSGIITANAIYDREERPSYHLRVLAIDQGSPTPLTSTMLVTVEIGDVNDNAPFFPFPFMLVRMFESPSGGAHVFNILATDLDNGTNASITYTLVSSTNDAFTLNETTGEITTTKSLDYELPINRNNILIISIRDRESTGEMTGTVSITLLDRNDNSPRLTSPVMYNLDLGMDHLIYENVPPGPVWATVSATDDDQGTNGELVYTLRGGNGDFVINDQGEIRTTRLLDYEAIQFYGITVEISDKGVPPNSLSVPLTFQVGDINDNAPSFENSVYEVSVIENSPAMPNILVVQATDADSGDGGVVDSYRIVSGNIGSVFRLNSTTGVLATSGSLDREVVDQYTVIVSATDRGVDSQTGTAEVRVTVTDVDDNPTLGGGVMDVFLVGRDNMLPVTTIAPVYFNDLDISNEFTDCLRSFYSSDDFAIDQTSCTLRLVMSNPPSGEDMIVAVTGQSMLVDTTININVSYISSTDFPDSSMVTVTINASATEFFSLGLNASLPDIIAQKLGVSRDGFITVSVQPGYYDHENSLDLTFSVWTPSGELLSPLAIINRLFLVRDELFVGEHGIVSIPTDPCLAEPCTNQAKCVITRTVGDSQLAISSRQSVLFSPVVTLGYQCDCVPGTAGSLCEVNYDDCYSNPCSYGVQCTDAVQGFICDCPVGTFGPDCSFNPDECISSPCQNGATCINEFNRYVCRCQPGYYGNGCQYSYFQLSPTCDSSPCQNGGTCSTGRDSYTCLCPDGFDGPLCEDEVLIQGGCIGNPCHNGSSCTNTNQGPQCTCSVGFAGPQCRYPLNNCELDFCENGAMCDQGFYGSYRCSCLPGYTGANCSVRITACESSPCENGGRCVDNLDGNMFTCQCPPQYIGLTCDIDLLPTDYCASSSCLYNCTSGSSNYTCTCPEGFQGRDCTLQGGSATPCSSNPCQYGGVCVTDPQRGGGYACNCSLGYTGTDCEVEIDECDVTDPCMNDGICVNAIGRYFCDCNPGVTGNMCQIHCPAGREGRFCEDVIQHCNASSCLNGGTCVEATGGFQCTCPVTHTGPRCESSNTCEVSKCANGGTCINLDGGGSECSCLAGFRGQSCELMSASFTGGPSVHSYRAFRSLEHQGQGKITFEFATKQAGGLLLFSTQYQQGRSLDFIVAEVVGGFAKVAMSHGSGKRGVALTSDSVRVNDGRWHQISIEWNGKVMFLPGVS